MITKPQKSTHSYAFFILLAIIGTLPHTIISYPVGNLMPELPKSKPGTSKEGQQQEFPAKISALQKQYHKQLRIPKKQKNTLRIATYNVHNWRGPTEELNSPTLNFEAQLRVIKRTNDDIVFLQEATNSRYIRKRLHKMGYNNKFVGEHKRGKFGNMILSKLPIHNVVKKTFDDFDGKYHGRAYIKAEFDLSAYGKKNLIVYDTHFAVENKAMRIAEAQELIASIKDCEFNKNIIIAADFNSQRNTAPLNYLEHNKFVDNFTAVGVTPGPTHWSGKTIDFIYGRYVDLRADKTYIEYDAASDHLLVVVDLLLK